jgi:hypothetical protein
MCSHLNTSLFIVDPTQMKLLFPKIVLPPGFVPILRNAQKERFALQRVSCRDGVTAHSRT